MCTYKDKYIPMFVRRPRLSSRQPFKNTVPRCPSAYFLDLNTAASTPGQSSAAYKPDDTHGFANLGDIEH